MQEVNTVRDHLTNLRNLAIQPERVAQHDLTEKILKTHWNKVSDPVHNALHAEMFEFKDTHSQSGVELDKTAKQLITLRSVDIQLMDDIHGKEKALHVDEVQVLQLRNLVKLRQV